MTYSLVHANTVSDGSASVTSITPACVSSTAGNLLVCVFGNQHTGSGYTTAFPAGWVKATANVSTGVGQAEVWYYPNCPAGITSAAITWGGFSAPTVAQILEFNDSAGANPAPLDLTGSGSASTGTSMAIAASGTTAAASELAVAVAFWNWSSATKVTLSAGTGFTSAGSVGNGTKQAVHWNADYQLNIASAGSSVTDTQATGGTTLTGTALGAIATFKIFTPSAGVTFVGSGTGTYNGVTAIAVSGFPAPQSGDVIIFDAIIYNTTVTTWPTGFTQRLFLTGTGNSQYRRAIATKLADGTEGTSLTATAGTGTYGNAIVYILRGVSSAIPTNTGQVTGGFLTTLAAPALTIANATDCTVYGYGGIVSAGSGSYTLTATPASLSNFIQGAWSGAGSASGLGWAINNAAPGSCTASGALDEVDYGFDFPVGGAPGPPKFISDPRQVAGPVGADSAAVFA